MSKLIFVSLKAFCFLMAKLIIELELYNEQNEIIGYYDEKRLEEQRGKKTEEVQKELDILFNELR